MYFKKQTPQFSWSELGCFLRPQSILCEEIGCGYGLWLLFLTSFYKSHGIDDYFFTHKKRYFNFVKEIFENISGVNFSVTHISEKDLILDIVIEMLSRGKTVIVPGNIRSLYYFKDYKEKHLEHYFIITSYNPNKNIFNIRDNLHLQLDNGSTEYENFVMTLSDFNEVSRLYWDTHVSIDGIPTNTFHQEKIFWVLNIDTPQDFLCKPYQGVSHSILELFRETMHKIETNLISTFSIDQFHLKKMMQKKTVEKHDIVESNNIIRAYLRDVNFKQIYIKILNSTFLYLCKSKKYLELLEKHFHNYQQMTEILRNKLFLKYIREVKIEDKDFLKIESDLLHHDHELRYVQMEALQKISL